MVVWLRKKVNAKIPLILTHEANAKCLLGFNRGEFIVCGDRII
jgi:hypothetical protein